MAGVGVAQVSQVDALRREYVEQLGDDGRDAAEEAGATSALREGVDADKIDEGLELGLRGIEGAGLGWREGSREGGREGGREVDSRRRAHEKQHIGMCARGRR